MARHISRRTTLKGIGCALALPLLESMGWAGDAPGKKGAKKHPVRMGFIFIPNGVVQPLWKLDSKQAKALPPTLEPLKPLMNDLLVISGLSNDIANKGLKINGGHSSITGAFLTCVTPQPAGGSANSVGVSVDQVAANRIGHLTSLPSIELGVDASYEGGYCTPGFNCSYTSNISWRSPASPMAKEINPKAVFTRLFTDVHQGASAQKIAADAVIRRSMLDLVLDDAKGLRAALGINDQRKIDEYLDSVRAMEQRIQHSLERAAKEPEAGEMNGAPPDFKVPKEKPADYLEHVTLMSDLMILAFQTDTTRIATFMYANDGSQRGYPQLGIAGSHHDVSHHGNDPKKLENLAKINLYHMNVFADFLTKMKAIKEGNGTLLDNSMILYGCSMGDGDRHNPNDLPILLAGRAGGTIKSGRTMQCTGEPLANLYLSMLARVGVPVTSFGDSTKMLEI
jgi:hypothetical protein